MLFEKHSFTSLKYNTTLKILQSQNFKNGCYNMMCPGFVQTNRAYFLGSRVVKTSTYGGEMVELPIALLQVISFRQI